MRRGGLLGLVAATTLAITACSGGGGQLAGINTETDSTTTTIPSTASTTTTPPTVDSLSTTTPSATATPAASTEPIPIEEVAGPKTAEATAKTIVRVERGLRGSNRDAARLEKLGRKQQLAYRALASHPNWVPTVLEAVPGDLAVAVQATIDAGAALNGLTGSVSAPVGFPDWQILTPEPPEMLRAYYAEGEQTYGVPWQYLAAIHLSETRMGRIHGNSTAGAQGPMQFIQSTWDAFGQGDINSNHDAIIAAAHYLQSNDAATDIDNALFRYNNDERYVAAIKAYASVMAADPGAYDGYYHWQVFYASADGTFLLPEGWTSS
ncbi:MAG: lytic transglycosylase domain-containing protein [Acidimicrobiia bacterium]|nr:lytic transglycosylase domain-containing protein [Acidimicrobiia bacterium]